jgi:hypothetical protein
VLPFSTTVQVSPACGVPPSVSTALWMAATLAEPASCSGLAPPEPASTISKPAVSVAPERLVSTSVAPTGVATRSPASVLTASASTRAISPGVSATKLTVPTV